MTRDEFIKSLCTLGACSCAGWMLGAGSSARAEEKPDEEIEALKGKLNFMRVRFAKLVDILSDKLDESDRKDVFEAMGRECARQFTDLTGKFVGKPEAFLEEIKRQWAKETAYDPAAGTIRVVDRSVHCSCAFVDEKLTPPAFCDCTLGWQKETYTMILGQPVDAELEESFLRGGKQCAYRMHVVKSTA